MLEAVAVLLSVAYVALLLLMLLSHKYKHKDTFEEEEGLPKLIWTYWHDETLPPLISRCVKNWKDQNPDYTVTVLNERSVFQLCGVSLVTGNVAKEFVARHSDFARLYIVCKYGGVWMDASTICNGGLGWLQDIFKTTRADFIGFDGPMTRIASKPIIENWFFAAPRGSRFMQDWLREAELMRSRSTEGAYVDEVRWEGIDVDALGLGNFLPYLIIHLCAAVVVLHAVEPYKLHIMKSCENSFKYLCHNDWTAERAIHALCTNPAMQTPLIKLRGAERA
ncbi:hypothetical protein TSOC_005124 [Tetrabaena socialis]|uniref:Uncharacterized protein n=1 Tax=Tetrabaena socialis TaxID=47790 RepID=A0A2J8A738_9CHLO|nr:hypothetical protein TSOC_005124 [Tetrabaena socialis]|eukprot:PNH08356.1 hypothetical protein TSOC_005124 [Tetrabaena socialis]